MNREEAEIYARNMSYEDALFNLTKAKAIPYKKATLIKVYELIQTLSQEPICDRDCEHCTWTECPIEPCDDAISREAVIKTINNNTADERDGWLCIDNDLVHKIEQLPSVTRKSGKWNEYYTSQKGNDVFNCNECGHTFVVMQGKDNMNYCPNCGTKMESEERNEF